MVWFPMKVDPEEKEHTVTFQLEIQECLVSANGRKSAALQSLTTAI